MIGMTNDENSNSYTKSSSSRSETMPKNLNNTSAAALVSSPRGIPKVSSFACQALSSSDIGLLDITVDDGLSQKLDSNVRTIRFSTAASNLEDMFGNATSSPLTPVSLNSEFHTTSSDCQIVKSRHDKDVSKNRIIEELNATEQSVETVDILCEEKPNPSTAQEEDILEISTSFVDETSSDVPLKTSEPPTEVLSHGTESLQTKSSSGNTVQKKSGYEEGSEGEDSVEIEINLRDVVRQLDLMEREIITPWNRDTQQNTTDSPSVRFAPNIQRGKPITFPDHWCNEFKSQTSSKGDAGHEEIVSQKDKIAITRPFRRICSSLNWRIKSVNPGNKANTNQRSEHTRVRRLLSWLPGKKRN